MIRADDIFSLDCLLHSEYIGFSYLKRWVALQNLFFCFQKGLSLQDTLLKPRKTLSDILLGETVLMTGYGALFFCVFSYGVMFHILLANGVCFMQKASIYAPSPDFSCRVQEYEEYA